MNKLKLDEFSIDVKDDNDFHLINHYMTNILILSELFDYKVEVHKMNDEIYRMFILQMSFDPKLMLNFIVKNNVLLNISLTAESEYLLSDINSYKEIFEAAIGYIE